jgi:hypothetical protein
MHQHILGGGGVTASSVSAVNVDAVQNVAGECVLCARCSPWASPPASQVMLCVLRV